MVQYIFFITFFLNIFIQMNHSFQISDFIVDYFVQKRIHVVNVLVCNQSDAISIHMAFQSNAPFLALIRSIDFKYNNYSLDGVMNTDHHTTGIFVDLSCENFEPLLEEVVLKIFSNCCYNVLFWNEIGIITKIKEVSLPFGTELICAVPEENMISLYNIVIITLRGPVIKKIGKWNNGFLLYESNYSTKKNLQKQILHGIISFTDQNIKNNSAAKIKNDRIHDLQLSTLAHFSLNVFGCLQVLYNFQWELTSIYDIDSLMILRNKFLNSNVNSVDFLMTTENHILNFSYDIVQLPSIKSIRQCFVFRHPPVYSYITFYLKPFSSGVWACLGTILIVSAILLYIMCLLKFEDIDYNELSMFGNILYCLGALINQGISVPSVRNSKRIIQFNILQLSLFLSNFYSAVILNYLLYPTHNMINNIDDVLEEGFDIGIENTTYNNITFSVTSPEIYHHNIPRLSSYYDVSTGVEKVRFSKFAFFSIESNINERISEYFTDIEVCDLSTVPLNKDYGLSMYLKNISPYKEIFQKGYVIKKLENAPLIEGETLCNLKMKIQQIGDEYWPIFILYLKEIGIISREDMIWNKKSQKCLGTVKYIEIGLTETSFAYKMFLFGFACSIIILLLEVISAKCLISHFNSRGLI